MGNEKSDNFEKLIRNVVQDNYGCSLVTTGSGK